MNNKADVMNLVKEIWSTELSTNKFSLNDDFFELGGNSLKLISVLDKLQKNSKLKNMRELTIIELFDHPTLNEVATLIESKLSRT